MVQMLIESGANVNARNQDGETALEYAAANGKLLKLFFFEISSFILSRDVSKIQATSR